MTRASQKTTGCTTAPMATTKTVSTKRGDME